MATNSSARQGVWQPLTHFAAGFLATTPDLTAGAWPTQQQGNHPKPAVHGWVPRTLHCNHWNPVASQRL